MEELPTSTPTPLPAGNPTTNQRRCQNCGSLLFGEHCYACGQPTKGLVRHFSSIVGDFLDSIFNFDTRTFRTLGPLLTRPGYLSNEYFHGHRVRYVSPVRLFFFLCIAAIFAAKLAFGDIKLQTGEEESRFAQAQTTEEVVKLRDELLADLREAREAIPDAPGARVGMDTAIRSVEIEAERRLERIAKRAAAAAEDVGPQAEVGASVAVATAPKRQTASPSQGEAAAETASEGEAMELDSSRIFLNGEPWHPKTNPAHIAWLPARANEGLNLLIARADVNLAKVRKEPRLLLEAFMEALPQTLFVLLPVFALLLKIFYLFKRRLYMEHLIVALHSHAFLCAAILLLVGLNALRGALGAGWTSSALGWVEAALGVWMPIYLLLMQKRVYRQGWLMTLLKYFLLGNLYLILLSFGAALNLAFSVVAM